MTDLENAQIPNSSPQKPQAKLVEDLLALQKRGRYEISNAEVIAETAFLFWSNFSDEELFGGRVKNTNPEMDMYALVSNKLFPLACDTDSGAFIQLSPATIKGLDPKTYSMIAAIGGDSFIVNICDAVNEEVKGRSPDRAPVVTAAHRAFPSANEKSPSAASTV